MDLVAGVRKEGSRGGRGEFKWTDVQSSQHRENYLGHSVMAPVGRWQQGRDLQWYSKSGSSRDTHGEQEYASERRQEIQRVKEAENDALNKALGYSPGYIFQTTSLGFANHASNIENRGSQKLSSDRGRPEDKVQLQRQQIRDQSRIHRPRRRRSRSSDYDRRHRDGDKQHSKRQKPNWLSESSSTAADRSDRKTQSQPRKYSRSPVGWVRERHHEYKGRARREQDQNATNRPLRTPTDGFGRRNRQRSRSPDF